MGLGGEGARANFFRGWGLGRCVCFLRGSVWVGVHPYARALGSPGYGCGGVAGARSCEWRVQCAPRLFVMG